MRFDTKLAFQLNRPLDSANYKIFKDKRLNIFSKGHRNQRYAMLLFMNVRSNIGIS